ncbi:hypothetical protein OA93_15460 [Flavobacterium sp. KMS]|uniref:hypothetical protein n=1 Tax=Flavobacterium sp. KMS TaxID=1566023 RepID=UPI00058003B2|nr:hypothetical protein [Flavobacterium sp. KMS]KIA97319.1 hypothetical protein OA93_15460 [Flavobacterium sp. KMS]
MKTINKIIVFVLIILNFSCDDILEKDISDDTIQIISPTNNTKIESNIVNFAWNNTKGVDKYRIQIFEANQVLVLDSLTTKTNITLPLKAGNYFWRVRGENYAYQSIYSFPSNFSTIIPDDLTNQQVILSSPENDKFVNFINISLNWIALDNATNYSVKVVNTTTSQEIFKKDSIRDTSVTLNLSSLADGNYEWRVKAKNIDTETKQYSARKFNIDTTSPNQPSNVSPSDNTINTNINFIWSIASDVGIIKSPITYVVEFSNNPDFTAIIQTKNSLSTTIQQSFSIAGVYYWRVKALDEAGNIGTNSTVLKFTIN